MDILIREERPEDYRAVELLTREAFWGFFAPSCDEHYLAHALRTAPAFVPALDLVAEADGQLVGNVMYSLAKVVSETGEARTVLTFGPLSVLPAWQGKGVGAALMRASLRKARDMGYGAVAFFGHPDYYPRFGFRPAAEFGIHPAAGGDSDALMAMALRDGGLDGVSGRFQEDPVFQCDPAQVRAFDRLLPPKAPAEMVPMSVLTGALPEPARGALAAKNLPYLSAMNQFSGRELLRWPGMDRAALSCINQVLRDHGFAPKLPPESAILARAQAGFRVLEELD